MIILNKEVGVNPNPQHLSKSPAVAAVAGVFVSPKFVLTFQ